MVEIATPLSIWVQLASLCFSLAGTFADLLVIRLFLTCAYLWLFVNAILGGPLWPNTSRSPPTIALDSLIWSIINLYVHGSCVVGLFLDERAVKMADDETALWRLFYRIGGLSKKLFYNIIACRMHVVQYESDQVIPTEHHLYIIYQGLVQLDIYVDGKHVASKTIVSGEMFDFRHLGMIRQGYKFVDRKKTIVATSKSPIKVFCFSLQDLKTITECRLAKGVWQTLLIENLTKIVERAYYSQEQQQVDKDYVDPIFQELLPSEKPIATAAGSGVSLKNPVLHVLKSIQSSFAPPYPFGGHPVGIRQTLLPAPRHELIEYSRSQIFRSIRTYSLRVFKQNDQARNDEYVDDT